jgi:hypothetical protein
MESEDESHPLDDEGVGAGDGAGRVAACDAAVTAAAVACPEPPGLAPGLAGFPHDGQKRAVPWIVAPQAGQNIEGILRGDESNSEAGPTSLRQGYGVSGNPAWRSSATLHPASRTVGIICPGRVRNSV